MDYLYIPQIATSLTLTSDIQKLLNLRLSFTLHFLDLVGNEMTLILAPNNPMDMLKKRRMRPSQGLAADGMRAYPAESIRGTWNRPEYLLHALATIP
ncbi:hypothetical protein TNCV_3870101 [Trichonephila clavipes]|nr:hypothetical protein TNCV_3870101 [Trichonephila clavipes]